MTHIDTQPPLSETLRVSSYYVHHWFSCLGCAFAPAKKQKYPQSDFDRMDESIETMVHEQINAVEIHLFGTNPPQGKKQAHCKSKLSSLPRQIPRL